MKNILVLFILILTPVLQTALAKETCNIGLRFELGEKNNAEIFEFTQKLKQSTIQREGIETGSFDRDKLSFNTKILLKRNGDYRRCKIFNLRYAGEKFRKAPKILSQIAAAISVPFIAIPDTAITIVLSGTVYMYDSTLDQARKAAGFEVMGKKYFMYRLRANRTRKMGKKIVEADCNKETILNNYLKVHQVFCNGDVPR